MFSVLFVYVTNAQELNGGKLDNLTDISSLLFLPLLALVYIGCIHCLYQWFVLLLSVIIDISGIYWIRRNNSLSSFHSQWNGVFIGWHAWVHLIQMNHPAFLILIWDDYSACRDWSHHQIWRLWIEIDYSTVEIRFANVADCHSNHFLDSLSWPANNTWHWGELPTFQLYVRIFPCSSALFPTLQLYISTLVP